MSADRRPRPPREVRPTRELPAHVTTPLLTQITQQSLDADYRHVAERKARARAGDQAGAAATGASGELGTSGAKPRRPFAWVVVVAAFGMLIAVAAVQTSRNAPADEMSRGALVKRIKDERADLAVQQERSQKLRADIAALQTRGQSSAVQDARRSEEVAGLERDAGFAAATGPGVVIELTDGKDGNALVQDADVSYAANALWESGATAVAVNGVRLTSLSAIRNSGSVIRVNRTAVASPYRVEGIGDPNTLLATLQDSSNSALVLQQTGLHYGFRVRMTTDEALALPSALALPRLRSATTDSGPSGARNRSQE